jgi:hypothetical protein
MPKTPPHGDLRFWKLLHQDELRPDESHGSVQLSMKDMTVHPRRCRVEEQPTALSPARHSGACRLLPAPAGELVAALKRKEPTAFEQLIAQHTTMLYRLAL